MNTILLKKILGIFAILMGILSGVLCFISSVKIGNLSNDIINSSPSLKNMLAGNVDFSLFLSALSLFMKGFSFAAIGVSSAAGVSILKTSDAENINTKSSIKEVSDNIGGQSHSTSEKQASSEKKEQPESNTILSFFRKNKVLISVLLLLLLINILFFVYIFLFR